MNVGKPAPGRGVVARLVTMTDHAVSPPAGATRERDRTPRARWGWLIGYFWSCIWLFWLISPLRTAWSHGSGAGVGVIVAFAMTYVLHFSRRGWVFSDHPEATHRVREDTTGASITRYSTMAALAVLAMMTVGQPGAACLVFTGIAAMWTFDIGPALAVSIATGCSYVLLWQTLDGWRAAYGSLIGMCFGTVACMAGRLSAARQWALDASREENALLLVQDERNRMARDLHDILGHSLTVITMKTELAGKLVDADPEAPKRQIAEVEQLARGALADVRTTVAGYREMSLSGEIARAKSARRRRHRRHPAGSCRRRRPRPARTVRLGCARGHDQRHPTQRRVARHGRPHAHLPDDPRRRPRRDDAIHRRQRAGRVAEAGRGRRGPGDDARRSRLHLDRRGATPDRGPAEADGQRAPGGRRGGPLGR